MLKEKDPTLYYLQGEKGYSYTDAEASDSYEKNVLDVLGIQEKSNVLDVSSGKGNEAEYMRKKLKAKVFELDISPDAYLANPKTDRNFILGDYTRLPYNDLSFDFIHLKDAIEHMPNKQGLFLETFRVLKPDGKILITSKCSEEGRFNYPFFACWEDGGWHKYLVSSMKEYKDQVKYIRTTKPGVNVSPPFFLLSKTLLIKEALKAGFKRDKSLELQSVWKPTQTEKNWGEFSRQVILLKK